MGGECAWSFDPKGLSAKSVIYSAGVGRDISFEHELIDYLGCRIILLDPSPTGLRTMQEKANQRNEIEYFPLGLAGTYGEYRFSDPLKPAEGSFSYAREGQDFHVFSCTDLSKLMQQHGHTHIDLLKMDIEGFEYDVIDRILRDRLDVRQLCIEFHYDLDSGFTRRDFIRAIMRLRLRGYRLIYRHNCDLTFLKG